MLPSNITWTSKPELWDTTTKFLYLMENLVRVSSKINHKNIKVVVQPTITHEDSKNLAQKKTITHEEEKVALILSLAGGL